MNPLVIGIGNRFRGDDAVGLLAVEAIEAEPGMEGVQTISTGGDLSDLALRWDADRDVIIIDAMVSGRRPGSVVVIDGPPASAWSCSSPGAHPLSSHGLGLAGAVALAQRLGRRPRSLRVVAVEIEQTEHLAPVSEPVRAALGEVVRRVGALLTEPSPT